MFGFQNSYAADSKNSVGVHHMYMEEGATYAFTRASLDAGW
jgi:hypothetical protein